MGSGLTVISHSVLRHIPLAVFLALIVLTAAASASLALRVPASQAFDIDLSSRLAADFVAAPRVALVVPKRLDEVVLALPALVYAVGGFGFWPILGFSAAIPLGYLAATRMWSVAHTHGLVTVADFVRTRFGSRALALLVAFLGILFLVQYMALQLAGMEAGLQAIGMRGTWPLWVAFGIVAIFTYNAGLRAPALMSIIKDILLLWLLIAAVLIVASTGGAPLSYRAPVRLSVTVILPSAPVVVELSS